MAPPLSGIRVLDLTRILAGPFCTMLLGDLGADVIKVEQPGVGDETRRWGPPFLKGESSYYLSVNRNKKSLSLNLKSEEGRQILYRLAEKSDIFLENFTPGTAERLGVGYREIRRINPRIIYCSISGFGQTGPYRERPAVDVVIQGMGGLMGVTGEPGRPPVRVGVAIVDIVAGMHAAIAILAALTSRGAGGEGQYIDVSLMDSSVSILTYLAWNYLLTGKNPGRTGSAHPNIVPYQAFEAGDGKFFIVGVVSEQMWRDFCAITGVPQLAGDPRFETNSKRIEHREELIEILSKRFLDHDSHHWLGEFSRAGIPCGPVNPISEVLNDPQVLSREMLLEVEHPTLGKLKALGFPTKFSKNPCELRHPPPTLGQHTEEILSTLLGYTTEEIERLKAAGAV